MSKSDKKKTDPAAGADAVDAANAVENMSDEALQEMLEQSRIVIRPGGEVVIENLTADLLDVAYELDPDNPGVTCDVPDEGASSDNGVPSDEDAERDASTGHEGTPAETPETS